jgi:hypothetical protein
MKYETYEHIAFISYLLFLLLILIMGLLSLLVTEHGAFVVLLFGIWGGITLPVAIIIGSAIGIVILLSLYKFRELTTGYRVVTIATLLYIGGLALLSYMPWGGEKFASLYGPLFTVVTIMYGSVGIWMLFSDSK